MQSVSEPATVAEASEAMRSGARVSAARLTRILEHEPGDLVAIVEAGLPLSELQAGLEPHGQMLALDPPGDPTIGACLAGDLSGPRRHRYGAMRDLVIGVTVVLADGTIANSGGKVVKNVAGYDLGKLFSGSRGRLGLIARVALRLHTRPAAEATVVIESDDPRAAWLELHRSQLTPSAVDFLPPNRLAVLFEGSPVAVDRQFETCLGDSPRDLSRDRSVWGESAARQGGRRPVPFGWQECLLARPGTGLAWVEAPPEPEPEWSPLAERVRAVFDPEGRLS